MDGGSGIRVTLLGAFQASRGGAALPVPGARLRALLVRLALAGGHPVEQSALVDAIWADDPPPGAAHALQSLVSRLRRALGSAGAVTQPAGGYRLAVAEADVDALRFERLAGTGRERLRAGDPRAAAAVLAEAVALWGDRPGAEPPAVAAVAAAVATRLAHASVEAVAGLAEAELSLGRPDAAAARLEALLAEHPVHERAAALLLDALAAQGRQGEALAAYERVRENLADVLGTDPGAALRDRHRRLLRGGPDPVASEPAGNLPAPVTSFLGREDDLARIDGLLAAGRLITVLGPGGAGKTRLAVEAARRHRHEFRDGVWMVDLAGVTEPAEVGAAVLAGIGRRGGAMFEARARTGGDELDVLTEQLRGRDCLLLADNCEHLVEAVAHLVASLLSRCAGLRVLATSREPLAVDGEALVPLGPLPLPEPGDGVEQARRALSVRLFTERAAAVRPGFTVGADDLGDVTRVVRGLDGMPLALELAAARLRTMSLTELAAGLSDRFRLLATGRRTAQPRHRTLRAVIAWSWNLLGEDERTVAERVSVLPGGVSPASAAAVCAGTTVPAGEVPELLAGLVDRSLLQLGPEPGRYRMLETLREYGIERLAVTGDLGRARDLAAGYAEALTARHDPDLRGPGQLAAMRVVAGEYDNALAALRRRCDTGDSPGAIAIALNLTWYWEMTGRRADAAYWLGEALAVPGEPALERDCARVAHLLNRGGTDRPPAGAGLPGRYAAFAALLHEDLATLDELTGDDGWLAGLAHLFRAQIAENAGDLDRVRTGVSAALARFRQAGDRWGRATVLPMRAQLRQYDGDLDGALADLREARSLAGEFGPLSAGDEIFMDVRWLDLHVRRGDTARAVATIGSARERARRAGATEMVALVDAWEADLWARLGDQDRSRRLLGDAERGLRDGTTFPGDHVRTLIGGVRSRLCLERGDLPGAQEALEKAYAAGLETGDLPILAQVAVGVARLAGARGRAHDAAVLLGTAARLRGAHDRTDRDVLDLGRLGRDALGEEVFATAYGKGWERDGKTAVTEVDPGRLAQPG